jgi:hypothetical protein
MAKPIVLVSAPKLIGDAENILLESGANITYMQYPVNEETLIAQLSASRSTRFSCAARPRSPGAC